MKKHLGRRIPLPALIGLVLCTPPAVAGPAIDRMRQTGKIVIAYRESSVPFSYLLPNKKPTGYAVDLCLAVMEAVRKKINVPTLTPEFMLVTPANRIEAIAEGKADLECGSTTNNAERREKVAFTVPHYVTGARYLVRSDSDVVDLQDFRGKRLVSTKGTTPLKSIRQANKERLIGITILEAPDHAKAVEMVGRGEADGFAMDDVLLYGLIAGGEGRARLKVVGKFLTIEPLAIMLPKNDPEFKKIVDDEMRRLIYSREATALYDKWFMRPIPPSGAVLNLPMNHLLRNIWKYPTDWVPI